MTEEIGTFREHIVSEWSDALAYAGGNLATLVDPTGHCFIVRCLQAGGDSEAASCATCDQ